MRYTLFFVQSTILLVVITMCEVPTLCLWLDRCHFRFNVLCWAIRDKNISNSSAVIIGDYIGGNIMKFS